MAAEASWTCCFSLTLKHQKLNVAVFFSYMFGRASGRTDTRTSEWIHSSVHAHFYAQSLALCSPPLLFTALTLQPTAFPPSLFTSFHSDLLVIPLFSSCGDAGEKERERKEGKNDHTDITVRLVSQEGTCAHFWSICVYISRAGGSPFERTSGGDANPYATFARSIYLS